MFSMYNMSDGIAAIAVFSSALKYKKISIVTQVDIYVDSQC